MGVAAHVRHQPLGVFAHLRCGVQGGTGVVEIGVALFVQAPVLGGPEVVERGGQRVVGKRDQEARERVLRHTISGYDYRAVVAAGADGPPGEPPQPQVVRALRAAP